MVCVEHHWAGQGTGAKARLRCPCTGIPLAEHSLCDGVKGRKSQNSKSGSLGWEEHPQMVPAALGDRAMLWIVP